MANTEMFYPSCSKVEDTLGRWSASPTYRRPPKSHILFTAPDGSNFAPVPEVTRGDNARVTIPFYRTIGFTVTSFSVRGTEQYVAAEDVEVNYLMFDQHELTSTDTRSFDFGTYSNPLSENGLDTDGGYYSMWYDPCDDNRLDFGLYANA